MPELTEAGARLLSDVRDAAQLALRRIVVDAARASKLPSLTAEQRTEWRERAEVWADTAAGEFAPPRPEHAPPRSGPRRSQYEMPSSKNLRFYYLARAAMNFHQTPVTARITQTT